MELQSDSTKDLRTMATTTSDHSEKRLQRAVGHVSAHWFPMNPTLVANLRKGLESGAYDLDVSFLIQELKTDFGLFTYCVKELLAIGIREGLPSSVLSDPIKLLRWAGPARLRVLLGGERQPPKTHLFEMAETFQATRLQETAVAATTAELLGEKQNLDGETAYCHGIVRQVGLNLIAWNYPALYARVVKNLTPKTTLDEELSKELGFSPAMLAMRLLRPALDQNNPQSAVIERTWQTYDTICSVGEALARAANPETYPTAEQDWEHAHQFINRTLGADGIELIKRRALENSAQYRKMLPKTFEGLTNFNPPEAIKKHRMSLRSRENPYVRQCPPTVQSALRALYSDMPRDKVDRTIVERILKQIMPQAGFTSGCVYVLEPTTMSLVPRAAFGAMRARKAAPVSIGSSSGTALGALVTDHISTGVKPQTDLAASAFACEHPLIERSGQDLPHSTAGIFSSLGKRRKIGVLYLEMPEQDLDRTDSAALKSFKAVRQALCDALLVD